MEGENDFGHWHSEYEYQRGDEVLVVANEFSGESFAIGEVAWNNPDDECVDVHFENDPRDPLSTEPATIGIHPSQMMRTKADAVEAYRFIGREDLLEPQDFEARRS